VGATEPYVKAPVFTESF
jgi:ribonuclease HI